VLSRLAAGEYGIRGHLTGWPIMAKHAFALAAADEDKPALQCERCGHRELLEDGGYPAAKARLRQHACS
jgi:hypothetical protein